MGEIGTDVIVVGGGGAGLAAAAEAARHGTVVVLEKTPRPGGTTAMAVGSIMASGTALQRRLGVADDAAAHAEDLARIAADLRVSDDAGLRDLLTRHAGETVEYLQSIGVRFIGPMDQPPHRHPRLHQIVPSARAYVSLLARDCRRRGVDIRCGWRATDLVVERGRVAGVTATGPDGAAVRLPARRGVILASGDVSANRDLMREFVGPDLDRFAPFNPACTGDGQAMAASIGARLVPRRDHGAEGLVQMRFAPPATASLIQRLPMTPALSRLVRLAVTCLPGAILRPFIMKFLTTALGPDRRVFEAGALLVNRDGERFADERQSAGLHDVGAYERAAPAESRPPPNIAIADQPGGEAFLVFDDRFARRFTAWPHFISTAPGIAYAYFGDYRRSRPDLVFRGRTVEELAARAGIDAGALARTVAAANHARAEAGGGDTPEAIDTPPFHALGPLRAWIFTAQVGLDVDRRLQVRDGDGAAIPGLYAAGAAGMGGFCSTGHGHSLAWAFTSGRLAGRHVCEDAG